MAGAPARQRRRELDRDASRSGWYEPLDWVLVRSPLLPVEHCLDLGGGDEAELPRAVREPVVRRAMAVASPSLFATLSRPPSRPSALRRRRFAVLRYLVRMSTRPTPYGLNAAVSLGRWGERTDLELSSEAVVRARLDMGLLAALADELERRPEVVRELRLETDPTVVVRAGRAVLPERLDGGGDAAEVSVRATRPVLEVLERCRRAPAPFREVAGALAEDFPDAGPRIEELILRLLREGLLVSELRPPLTRGDPARYLLARLDGLAAARGERERLAAAVAACEGWQVLAAADGADGFAAVLRTARAVAAAPPAEAPVRVDMMRPLAGEHVARAVGEEAARAAELLLRLSPLHAGSPSLNAFRDRFLERYPAPTEVPLLELIQPDVGLGPPDPRPDGAGGHADERALRRDRRLLEIATSALRADELSFQLDPSALADLDTGPRPEALPATVEVAIFVAAGSREALDAGEFRVVVSPLIGSPAAGRILGRFAYLFDGRGERAMEEAARREDAGGSASLRAELVYRPARLGSATIRPATRSHEIVVGAAPGVPRERVIPVDELVVGVREEQFYLRWPKGGTYVEVCESHMLNPARAPAVSAFLAQMRLAGRPLLTSFQWGVAGELPRLPRVEMGRVVLSLATWRPPFRTGALDPAAPDGFASGLASWRARWRLPRRVFAAQGDNRLLLDLDDPEQVELLRGLVRSADGDGEVDLVLQEALPGVGDAWLPGPGGGFLAELAVPLARVPGSAGTSPSELRHPPARLAPAPGSARRRAPGSEWLYAKLEAGGTTADQLVGGPLAEFARDALVSGLAADWFFIRYRDERPHLRVRFRGEPRRLAAELTPRLYAWASDLMDRGACQAFALDTYERELERYGGETGMDVAEAVFGVDSGVVVELVRLDLSRAIGVPRDLLCVLTLDCLLEGLGLDAEARLRWCARHAPSRGEVTTEWRRHKRELRSLLGSRGEADGTLAPLLERFRHELRPHGERLAALTGEGAVAWPPVDDVLASFVHMHCNRLLGLDRDAERRALGLLGRTRASLARAPVR